MAIILLSPRLVEMLDMRSETTPEGAINHLSRSRSASQTVQAVLLGVKASMTSTRNREACRSNREDAFDVPSCTYISPAANRATYTVNF